MLEIFNFIGTVIGYGTICFLGGVFIITPIYAMYNGIQIYRLRKELNRED